MKIYIYILLFVIIFVIIVLLLIMVNSPKKNKMLTNKIPSEADYVIIGAGAAGSVLARRLSDKYSNKKIVILEQGIDRRNEREIYRTENAINISSIPPYSSTLPSNIEGVNCTFGTMYGGSTSHNYGLVVEGSDEYYKNFWFDRLNINENDLNKYKSKVWSFMTQVKVTPTPQFDFGKTFYQIITNGFYNTVKQGLDVLLNLGPLGMDKNTTNIIMKAIKEESGDIPVLENYNDSLQNVSPNQILFVDPANGVRASSNRQYIPNYYYKNNLSLVQSAKVSHIDEEGNVILYDGNKIKAKKIILSAGAIYTPLILKRSFINEDIKKEVGKSLYNHYGAQMILGIKNIPLFSAGPLAYIAEESGKRRKWQCLVVGAPLINYELLNKNGLDHVKLEKEGYVFVSFILFILNPTGEGYVEENKVILNMYNDLDSENIVNGMKWFEKIFMRLKNDKNLDIIAGYPTENQWKMGNYLQLSKDSSIISEHYSCTMNKLLDQNFKLKNHENIFVVDASAFPEQTPDANTEFPTLLLAEIAADRL